MGEGLPKTPPFPPDETCLGLQIHVSFFGPLQRPAGLRHPPAVIRKHEIGILILTYNQKIKIGGGDLFFERKEHKISQNIKAIKKH